MKKLNKSEINCTIYGLISLLICLMFLVFSSSAKAVASYGLVDSIQAYLQDAGWVTKKPVGANLLFREDFNEREDWQTTTKSTMTVPEGWDAGRTDEQWHPADGDTGTQPSMMINGNIPEQVYGGTGKAFITYSESFNDTGNNGFTSDGILTKDIEPTNEVYATLKVKFQNGWASNSESGQIKLIRFSHWKGEDYGSGERYKFFSDGNNAPIYIYDWAQNDYGLRHFHAFRCDDQATNYYCTTPSILNPPRAIVTGDMSANYTTELTLTDPQIPDLINGGFIARSGSTYHNNLFGDDWHTVAIYLKLNSAPGVQDGVLKYWIDGEKIVNMDQIPWVGSGGDMGSLWNNISIGGNDRFHFDLVGDPADRERWYAIDDIEVYDGLPQGVE